MTLTISSSVETARGCGGVLGRVLATLFFSVFLGMGLIFSFFVGREAVREAAPWLWPSTPCKIMDSGVEGTGDDERPYALRATYTYTYRARDYTSDRVRAIPGGTADYTKAQAAADRYRPGSIARCRVNPLRPGEAVLERRVPWQAAMLLIPLVFVVVGAGGMIMVWRVKEGEELQGFQGPISARARRGGGCPALGAGILFLIVGIGGFGFLFVRPALQVYVAQGWKEVPCRVVSSSVRSHDSDDGTTYSVDILYEYSLGDRTLRSNRYDFASWSSSGYRGKRSVVERYPPGLKTACFVDPVDTSKAVLDRSFRAKYLVGLTPLLFAAAGVAILAWAPGSRRRRERTREGRVREEVEHKGSVTLSPRLGPVAKFLGTIALAAFWNGLVSVFVVQVVRGWMAGNADWFLTLFMVPFVLVGLGFVAGIGYTGLALLNPRPRLTLVRSAPRLGEVVDVTWGFSGRTSRIDQLRITLEGREEATYTRGTDTKTDTEVFSELVLTDTVNSFEIGQGRSEVRIPEDTMHSFAAAHNKVVWALKVHGDIPRWPDVNAEFPVTVRPLRSEDIR